MPCPLPLSSYPAVLCPLPLPFYPCTAAVCYRRTVSVESDVSPQQLQPVSAKLEIRVFDKSEGRRSEAGPPPPAVPTIAVVTPSAPVPAPVPIPVSSVSSAAAPQNNQVR